MLIKVINPNTTASMTVKIGEAARQAARDGTKIVCVSPEMGPVSIEGHYDEAIALSGLLTEVARGEADGTDGYVIACFGDPGLLAAREIAAGPVVGVAEAAMHLASLLATGFSVVTTLERTCVIAEQLVRNYGMERACRRIRAADVAVLDLEIPHRMHGQRSSPNAGARWRKTRAAPSCSGARAWRTCAAIFRRSWASLSSTAWRRP